MSVTELPAEVVEVVCEHLSVDVDDAGDMIAETTSQTADQIAAHWHERTRDLSHLSRDERQGVLQGAAPFRPWAVAGCDITLYTDVQVLRGQRRVAAAVIDTGERRVVVMGS